MVRPLYAGLLLSLSVLAAEPVNQDEELTLELLEFLAEFGEQAETVPVSEDEWDEAQELSDEKAVPATVKVEDVVKRGEQK